MSSYSKDLVNLYRSRKTLLAMLTSRGYVVPQKKMDETIEDLANMVGDNGDQVNGLLTVSCIKDNPDPEILDEQEKIVVFFSREDRITSNLIGNLMAKLNEENVFHCIIVAKGLLTPSAHKARSDFGKVMDLQIFHEDELCIDITKHTYVPKHILMTDDEKKELLARYRIKECQLPKIQRKDPVARYMGLKMGQVVKIIRASETAGKYITYRVCI